MRVVVIGGGAMGSSLAYWLTGPTGFKGEVVVVERDPTYARASSALSASSIRQQYSTPVNIAIGRFGVEFLRRADEHLMVEDEPPGIFFHERGYLFLATAATEPILRQNHDIQRRHGAEVALLDPAALQARFPWLATDGVALASLGLAGEGWFDGYGLMRAFRRRAIAQGARYLHDEVVGLELDGSTVSSVRLAKGEALAADIVVDCGGPWSAEIAAMAGIALPVHPRRRCVFVVDCPDPLPGCPLVIDTSGAWLRPDGRYYLCGISPAPRNDPDGLPLEVEHSELDELVWPALAARIPVMERLKVKSSWAGYYDYNTVDQNGLVGPFRAVPNLYVATGFSGHGIQQSPAIGRGLAEHIVHGHYRTLDLGPLSVDRLADGRPLLERNII